MQKRSELYGCAMDCGKQSEKPRFSNTQIWLRRASPLGGDLILAYYINETPISKPTGNESCTERVGHSLEASFA